MGKIDVVGNVSRRGFFGRALAGFAALLGWRAATDHPALVAALARSPGPWLVVSPGGARRLEWVEGGRRMSHPIPPASHDGRSLTITNMPAERTIYL